MSFECLPVDSAAAMVEVRILFREYAGEWNLDLCFQNFEEELASLPGCYSPPPGRLLIARTKETLSLAGCVAVREFAPGVAEMKRLYVRPPFRGFGLGRLLAETSIGVAREIGYRVMRLDTLERMKTAVALYESLGFRRIAAYRENPEGDVVYLELPLVPKSQ
jgi:ribosomal protein S18 acetylase RimI-like enzyme